MKTLPEENLLKALLELDKAVKTLSKLRGKPDLLPLFAQIDDLTKQLPHDSDPALLHYLHRKSYEKARLHLELKVAG